MRASVPDVKMGHTLLCVLGFLLLNTLLYGHDKDQNDEKEGSADDSGVETRPTGVDRAILEIPAFPLFEGDSVILRCKRHTPRNEAKATFFKDGSPVKKDTNEMPIFHVSVSHRGTYSCKFDDGAESKERQLDVKEHRRKVTLTAEKTIIPVGGHVKLTCSVGDATDLKYEWFGRTSDSPEKASLQTNHVNEPDRVVSRGGRYTCRGWRREPDVSTPESDAVTIREMVPNTVVASLQPNWTPIFEGETITVRCDIQGGEDTKWTYEWTPNQLNNPPTLSEYKIKNAIDSHSGSYKCKGRRDSYSSTNWSNVVTLTVLPNKPKAELSADSRDIPVGGSVTLTCSVNPSSSSGWKYYWYRGVVPSKLLTTQDAIFLTTGQIRVSQGGRYWCRGGRGEPVYYTDYSYLITINKITVADKVTLHPIWSEIYKGETITLRCEVKNGGDAEWVYEWRTSSSVKPPKQTEHRIRGVSAYHRGSYRCKGRMNNAPWFSTDWSDAIKLTVPDNNPQPVLTVSPLWLNPGDSVTLNCNVTDPSAGWRFYWYKAVPKLVDNSYRYELLPGSTNGTEQDSFIVHGQTLTAGYACRAGRGDLVFYTLYSEHKFAWSGDFHSSASLTVSPDRVQHFLSESVSVICKGNSTVWRVKKFTEQRCLLFCSSWGTLTRSTCNIRRYSPGDTSVYWCEFGSGEFSNAVNITSQEKDIILVSPVYPVTQGQSASLSCILRGQKSVTNVFFYRNGELIQSDTRRELNISVVSMSDEGFYKCKSSQKVSPQSWMSVKPGSKPEGSSFPAPLITGLVCGIALILLLLLFYFYRPSKDLCFIRPIQSEGTNRGSAASRVVNQHEAQHNEYSSPLDDAAYSQAITYSVIELKNTGKKGKQHEPEESVVYSDVRIETADNTLMYAQVNCHNKGKAKKNKGKSMDETVYSEVKPGTALGP